MKDASKAKIYLAEQRGVEEDDRFRSYKTFNAGKIFNAYKTPFGRLYGLNDESLAGGQRITINVPENSLVLIIPIVGAITYKDSQANVCLVGAGEILAISLPARFTYEISNPYETELINYIRCCIRSTGEQATVLPAITAFNLVAGKNNILEIDSSKAINDQGVFINIGQFTGRNEFVYQLKEPAHSVFAFVIEGAFELQGRLLHARDGLALWDLSSPLELEALSNEAIILLIELV